MSRRSPIENTPTALTASSSSRDHPRTKRNFPTRPPDMTTAPINTINGTPSAEGGSGAEVTDINYKVTRVPSGLKPIRAPSGVLRSGLYLTGIALMRATEAAM